MFTDNVCELSAKKNALAEKVENQQKKFMLEAPVEYTPIPLYALWVCPPSLLRKTLSMIFNISSQCRFMKSPPRIVSAITLVHLFREWKNIYRKFMPKIQWLGTMINFFLNLKHASYGGSKYNCLKLEISYFNCSILAGGKY